MDEEADYITELNSPLEVIGVAEMVLKSKTKYIKKEMRGENVLIRLPLIKTKHTAFRCFCPNICSLEPKI